MKRSLASLVLPALSLVSGCGSEGVTTAGPLDGGAGATADLTMPGGGDMAKTPDLVAIEVPGTKLVSGTYDVVGVTTDDLVVAYDVDTGAAVAVSLAGGAKQEVNKLPDSVEIDGKVLFVGAALDQITGLGEMWVWTAKSGAKMLDANSLVVGSASDDGAWIAWSGHAAADASATDIFVGKSDGTGAVKVFGGALNDDTCYPDFGFHGSTLLVSHCEMGGMGATLHVVDPATGKATLLADKLAPSYSADKTGAHALVITMDGMGELVTVADAMVSAITNMDDGFLVPDGSAAVYLTGTDMFRFPLPAGPRLKLTGNISQLDNTDGSAYDLSPDGKWLVVPGTIDADNGTSELFLVSTQTPQGPITLVNNDQGAIFGDSFTRDSSAALYFTAATNGVGPMHAQPVAGGRPVDLGYGRGWYLYAGGGNKVVWNDNYVDDKNGGLGTADILVADTTRSGNGSLIAANADEDFALSTAGDKVAFSSRVTDKEGLYVVPVP